MSQNIRPIVTIYMPNLNYHIIPRMCGSKLGFSKVCDAIMIHQIGYGSDIWT